MMADVSITSAGNSHFSNGKELGTEFCPNHKAKLYTFLQVYLRYL